MKIQVLQQDLDKALSVASRFTSARAQLPILSNVLLLAHKNKLQIASTNLETSVSLSIGAQVDKEGSITVPSRVIGELVANLPKESLKLSLTKERLTVETGESKADVAGIDPTDFPAVPKTLGKKTTSFSATELLGAVSKVVFSVSSDESRPILTGVLVIITKSGVALVSTDGFRLSKKLIKTKTQSTGKVIIPRMILSEIGKLPKDSEIGFATRKSENQVVFSSAGTVMSSRVLEGTFPDFERIIPEKSAIKINVDRQELLRAVKLASVFAKDSSNVVKISVTKNSLEIAAESSSSGSQKTKVDISSEGTGPKTLEISFNCGFLEEILGALEGESVKIGLSDAASPGVFTDPEDLSYLHLIMPVKA